VPNSSGAFNTQRFEQPDAIYSAKLEYQYNARAAVPGYAAIFEKWAALSESTRGRIPSRLDIPYGTGIRQKLDLFEGQGRRLHLFLHGGYWQAMDKSYFSFLAEGLVRDGTDVAICNYPLCPDADLGEILDSVRMAVGFLREHGRSLERRWQSLQLSGHSAGGQLAAMLLASDWARLSPGMPDDFIAGAICISGLYDLDPLRYTTLNDKLGLGEKQARLNSPLFTQPVGMAPMLLVVGGDERPAFHQQMATFAAKRRSQGIGVDTLVLEGLNHFTVVEQLAEPDSPLYTQVNRLYKNPE